jgi:hypothetical protein
MRRRQIIRGGIHSPVEQTIDKKEERSFIPGAMDRTITMNVEKLVVLPYNISSYPTCNNWMMASPPMSQAHTHKHYNIHTHVEKKNT